MDPELARQLQDKLKGIVSSLEEIKTDLLNVAKVKMFMESNSQYLEMMYPDKSYSEIFQQLLKEAKNNNLEK